MARWLLGLTLVFPVLLGCGNASPPEEPRSQVGSTTAFSVVPELVEIDPYPGGGIKNVGPAIIMKTPVRRPGATEMGRELTAISKVPPDRFQTDVAPLIGKELKLPNDAGVIWQFRTEGYAAVVVSAQPLAAFDDIASAEPHDSHYESVALVNGKMTQREGVHTMVRVTFSSAAKARIQKDARGRPLIVAYGGWAAGRGEANAEPTLDFRFDWLDDAAADKAARDFIATVNSRRRRP